MNELTIQLESRGKIPMYEQIYRYIRGAIRTGKLSFHEKLPSTRSLAAHLGVSRSTVELSYEQLLSEGYIETIPCKGYYVAQIEGLYQLRQETEGLNTEGRNAEGQNTEGQNTEEQSTEDQGTTEKRIQGSGGKTEKEDLYEYDFSPYGIDVRCFPYQAWKKLSKEVLSGQEEDLFSLGDPRGEYKLRREISTYLYQARGVNCESGQIIVGAGNDYLLMLLAILLGRKRSIAFENPTYKQAYRLFQNLSYEVMTVDMDEQGMQVDQLGTTKANVAYVMPSHQFPLGVVMPLQRRLELLSWANEQRDRYIIEDDYDSEFRYKGKPIPALQGYDKNGKVIYLGTFSKSIAPAIRMSYMVLPDALYQIYQERSRFMSSTVSRVDQLMVAGFLENGGYERHLNKARALYKNRHDLLLKALRPLQDVCKISGEQAGVHFLLSFRDGRTEQELIERAKEQKIKVYGLSSYETDPETLKATVLLGYANMSEEKLVRAASILTQIWCQ